MKSRAARKSTEPPADGLRSPRAAILCLGIAVAIASVTTLRYSPRFVYWRGVHILTSGVAPEFGRAQLTLRQLDNPWSPVRTSSHQVIGWRLLFPVAWHYSRLPADGLLAVPQLGCLLVLWLVAWLSYVRLRTWSATIVATALFAPLPWFFVSSGWLAYFDSWLVLGLLVAAFVPSRSALAAACILTPWVDERFLIALPLTMLVRALALGHIEARRWRDIGVDVAVACVASAPYPAIRAVAWLRGDPHSTAYVHDHWTGARDVPWMRYAKGLWSGYRAAWIVIVVGIALVGRQSGWKWAGALATLVAVLGLGGLMIAADMSRSLVMLCPALLLGAWLCWSAWRGRSAWLLAGVATLNLLLPATHVLWNNKWTIHSLPEEWAREPEPFFAAALLLAEGRALYDAKRYVEARQKLDEAIALDDSFTRAYFYRGMVRAEQGDRAGCEDDMDAACRLQPNNSDMLYLRAVMRGRLGDAAGELLGLQEALRVAAPDWPLRAQAEQAIANGGRTGEASRTPAQP